MEKKKILVVDDDETALRLLEHHLSAAGYQVITANDGKEGVELVRGEKPNLVLLDIYMTTMGGAEAADILRRDPQTKDIPIIYLTGILTKDEEDQYGHEIGGNFFMAKPYDIQELLKEIQKRI